MKEENEIVTAVNDQNTETEVTNEITPVIAPEKTVIPAPINNKPTNQKIKIGITIGDINGIGTEVIIKTFFDNRMLDYCTPVIYGSSRVISYHRKVLQAEEFNYAVINDIDKISPSICNVFNCWNDEVPIVIGKPNPKTGKFVLKSLDIALKHYQEGKIDAIVTAPINKSVLNYEDPTFIGHTEYFTNKLNVKASLMLLINNTLRVGLVTNHVPVSKISELITEQLIIQKVKILDRCLRQDFGIIKPKIALLALNPHAGDDGLIGNEDDKILKPAIEKLKDQNMIVFGPYAADGFFGAGLQQHFDAVLAMYHDQGLVPFKTLSFGHGVNYTAGLPLVRTSPDHGTAYDIAGKNIASEESFRQAVFMAIDIVKSRAMYAEMYANPIQKDLTTKVIGENVQDEELVEEI